MVLNSCCHAHGAGYQHGHRNGCLKGTRESVLDEIEHWARDFSAAPVFWLSGLAGTGKSTIAQSIAERASADGNLGASFFCSRGVEDRSNLHLIFPTLAFQLAQKYPAFRSSLVPLLQSNPDVVHESLLSQMQRLIAEPLISARVSTVIVVDALDECVDEDPESAILLVLGQLISGISKVKFFVTSRLEIDIMSDYRLLPEGAGGLFTFHQVDRYTVDHDIRRFFKHELFNSSHREDASQGWPTEEQVDSLGRRAAGFFVYATAAVRFLKHKFISPSKQLDVIMASPASTMGEVQAGFKGVNNIDSLYASILHAALFTYDDAVVRSILSAMVLVTNPLSPSAIANLMGFDCGVVISVLKSVQSLLVLHEDIDQLTQPFHQSFPGFVTDPSRCNDPRFYISPDNHIDLFLCCLALMGKSLKKNMCSIPDFFLNSEMEDLVERIEASGIRGALEYACRSWFKHLILTERPDRTTDVLLALRGFLEKKFIFWLEALSILGAVDVAVHALGATLRWLNQVRVGLSFKSWRCSQSPLKLRSRSLPPAWGLSLR